MKGQAAAREASSSQDTLLNRPRRGATVQPGKVLVVDDAPAIIETMKRSLQRLGVPAAGILTASTKEAALRLFKEHQPPVVFIDMNLGLDLGDEAAQEMLQFAPTSKIIVVTGLDPAHARVRDVVSAGAYAVIEKPVRLAGLRDVLDLIQAEDKGLRRVH